jgi:hypothetical protein
MNTKAVKPAEKETAPNGAKIELLITINSDEWDELKAQGFSADFLEKELVDAVRKIEHSRLIADIENVTLIKFY